MTDERDPLSLDEQVCFALAVAARSVIACYKDVLAPLGLTHPQYLVMLALWETDRRSVRDLSSTLRLEPGTVSPLVKRLEEAGYVTREKVPLDDRSIAVTLTPAGRALREQALAVPGTMLQRFGMDTDELGQVNTWLHDLIDRAENALAAGPS